ncbi:MAG: hypothetical protein JRH20_15460 [Deltaproteobacteria bacterium]|nr:hypothetical protein [Deltaproteobacteria bacterium]
MACFLKPLSILSLVVLLGSCSEPHALLLTVKGASFVETFDLSVKDLITGEIILERRQEPVDAADPNRDISQAGQELKLSVEFAAAGNYLIHFVGHTGTSSQVALRDFRVDGVREESITLVSILDDQDQDGDGFPVCGAFGDCVIAQGAITCVFLDCDDTDPNVHPFGIEVCGNGKDDDCDQGCGADPLVGDEECKDEDGDGVAGSDDCDDHDPCRAPTIREAPNLCGVSAADFVLPQACLEKLAAAGQQPPEPPFCGDGVDQSCSGGDIPCVVDEDCDGVSPPDDCNDKDPTVNPSAKEKCDDTVDNNCNGVINEGCAPCDVDGDNHAAVNLQDPNCTGADGQPLPTDDEDDYDAGVYPGVSGSTGNEGGTRVGALREFCSRIKLSKDGATVEANVDHDLDGRIAAEDGCPDVACDSDGDGFRAANCNPPPPKAEEDCNDQDAHVFPGAPEVCGDSIDQSCSGTDVPCTNDKDGDGYLPPDDCNDDPTDPDAAKIHPWATEVCDAVDNDCDGLVNEGNPDPDGDSMSPNITCTDDNDGACGQALGRCACTKVDPGAIDVQDRVACEGEDLQEGATSPRCVGAGQPKPESCVQGEDLDCNEREDDPTGANLADRGKVCGVSVGNCTPGQVVGCDFSRVVPNLALIQAVQAEFNGFWVCADAELPVPEACNGKDDDCNGVTPRDELDSPPPGDNDGYLGCSGCTTGSGRLDLAAQYRGCGDCNATNSAVYPTQDEFCNDVDDNCRDGITDDGADECTTNQKCCSSQRACRNILTDALNCGDCGVKCTDRDDTDLCVGGACACGSTGGPCPSGLDCVSGQCRCISNGRCTGCCADASTCITFTGQSTARCGLNGASCASCDDSNECSSDTCNSGVCSSTDRSEGTSCASGAGECREGDCCNGCWDGSLRRCLIGSDQSATRCGDTGVICQACTTSNQCETPTCSTERCTFPDKSDTTLCSSGQCRSGNCCTGCWNSTASQCLVGTAQSTALCGDDGNSCQGCTTSNECQQPACSSERCVTSDRPDGLACASNTGKCRDGNCCTGCWSVFNTCLGDTFQSISACGDDGNPCGGCTSTNECRTPRCVGGACTTNPVANATSCGSNTGQCWNGNCCTGCWNGSSCVPYSSQNSGLCGDNGVSCGGCTTTNECKTPVCTTSGCSTINKGDGTVCASGAGQCRQGNCCMGCWDGSNCVSFLFQSTIRCGDNGASCGICLVVNECETAACTTTGCATVDVDGAPCDSGNGECHNGTCCPGGTCWNGVSCVNGSSNDVVCGTDGGSCTNCGTGQCNSGTCCSVGTCWNGTSCVNGSSNDTACGTDGDVCVDCGTGQCNSGTCCSVGTCWNGSSCAPGSSNDSACGTDGDVCVDCGTGQCNSGTCCSVGTCWNGSSCVNGSSNDSTCGTDGDVCVDCGTGQCNSGTCCSVGTCWNGSSCAPGSSNDSACGTDGDVCVDCGTGQCNSGTCCSVGMCWDGNSCEDGSSTDTACGTDGGSCTNCTTNGKVCNSGSCQPS